LKTVADITSRNPALANARGETKQEKPKAAKKKADAAL
jgi:hypothetical protein